MDEWYYIIAFDSKFRGDGSMKYLGKKILMIMMAVSLVLAAVPYRSLTAQERFLVVGEVEVTDENKDDILPKTGIE